MAILNIKQKIEPYVKNATGYIKLLLSSKHVVMENGNDLETTITNLNSEIDYDPTEHTYSNNSWELTYRYINHNQIHVYFLHFEKGGIGNVPGDLVIAGIPFNIKFDQRIPVFMLVGSVTVGYGNLLVAKNNGIYLTCTNYGNDVSLVATGIITVDN